MRRSWRSSKNAVRRRKAINNPIDKKDCIAALQLLENKIGNCRRLNIRRLRRKEEN
ncbi:hypothetical protein F240042I4_59930 [Eisenbergiella tayi]